MTAAGLWAVEWTEAGDAFEAVEPTPAELRAAAPALAVAYNDAHNRRMMAHDDEPYSADDVVTYYQHLRAEGGHPFLLRRGGALAGDADFRNLRGVTAEFAIMIAARAAQGQGLGSRFATMLHTLGFGELGLERIYISVIPANVASQRLFEKLGYQADDSLAARSLIDDTTDLTFSVGRAAFAAVRVAAGIRTFRRPPAAAPLR